MGGFGLPELFIVLIVGSLWLVPIAAAVWALITLQRVRAGQDVIRAKLETIERLLQRA